MMRRVQRITRDDDPPASALAKFFLQEDINFLVTNRLPRALVTRAMGWFSRIENPALARVSIALWRLFADDLALDEAKTTRFRSLHDCFIRELKAGARIVDADPDTLVSPCDAVIGAHGLLRGTEVIQAKGFHYTLDELLGDPELVEQHRDGFYVTLRLKANMYHRFHAPLESRLTQLSYVSGDFWNVNPIALRRVEKLFCKNERAIVRLEPTLPETAVTLVPIAAILVGSMRFRCVDVPLAPGHRGRRRFECNVDYRRGEELGRFEAGSTIILFATGPWRFSSEVREGATIRMGQALMRFTRTQDGADTGHQ
jgi:phosphatidylserine decarboxylase